MVDYESAAPGLFCFMGKKETKTQAKLDVRDLVEMSDRIYGVDASGAYHKLDKAAEQVARVILQSKTKDASRS